jgi:DNA-directed RNA polymerase specialized sigma24 family protein
MRVRTLYLDDSGLLAPGDSPRAEVNETDELEAEFGGDEPENDPELCLYRGRTVILLRRYLRMSLEAGRLPSLLGREFFRTHFTAYQAHTFEDVVIFVHDVEASLEELDETDRKLIAMIALQEHSQEEAARLLGYARRSIGRHYAEALDRVSEIFLRKRILEAFPCIDPVRENSCQEGKIDDLAVSDCDHGKNNFEKNGQLPPVV